VERVHPERIEPAPGQESVWDYPRPPVVVPSERRLRVVHAGVTIADSRAGCRVLETSQPPAFYIPPADIAMDHIVPGRGRSYCEWKGAATYWSVVVGDVTATDAAWSYERPTPPFAAIAGHLAFYAQRVDECWVDDERVQPNPGDFYGGWITADVVGPFKGGPGSRGW
jgi:uncharacterized protein (DUF427 family)